MKKIWMILALVCLALSLAACNLLPPDTNFDNNSIVGVEGQEGYYTDGELVFCTEIRGSYRADRPFTLDAENESLRVWDNMYLYEYDYFQLIQNETPNIFYKVKDEDLVYVTLNDSGAKATINEGQSGIYRITFDLDSKVFDLEYKGEITTPVYEKMDGCDIYSLASGFTAMSENPENPQEWMIENYAIEMGAYVSIHNHGDVHLSNYKVILEPAVQGKYATAMEDGDKHLNFAVGGKYNIYVNLVTYEVRVELADTKSAEYSLYVYQNGEPVAIEAANQNTPYLFYHEVSVRKFASLPISSAARTPCTIFPSRIRSIWRPRMKCSWRKADIFWKSISRPLW